MSQKEPQRDPRKFYHITIITPRKYRRTINHALARLGFGRNNLSIPLFRRSSKKPTHFMASGLFDHKAVSLLRLKNLRELGFKNINRLVEAVNNSKIIIRDPEKHRKLFRPHILSHEIKRRRRRMNLDVEDELPPTT